MTIANVTSGLHGTGIYPFSPRMVMDKFQAESNSSSQPSTDHVVATSDSQSGTQSAIRSLVEADLKPEMIEQYERRLENGYGIYTNASYVAWLEKFHPEHVPPLTVVICQYFKNFIFFKTVDVILQQNEIGDTVSSEAREVHVPGERDNSDQTTDQNMFHILISS